MSPEFLALVKRAEKAQREAIVLRQETEEAIRLTKELHARREQMAEGLKEAHQDLKRLLLLCRCNDEGATNEW
jgi:hypothetical protein